MPATTMKSFLKNYKSTQNDSTHTILLPPAPNGISGQEKRKFYENCNAIYPNKWKIPDEKLEEFYRLYIKEHKKKYALVERHKEDISPITIDLDIQMSSPERKLTNELIEKIIMIINDELEEITDEIKDPIIMQRPEPYQTNGIYKDGLHIMYPKIVTKYVYQEIMRKKLLQPLGELLKEYGILNDIEKEMEKIYDESVIKTNGMMLYMCSKYVDGQWIEPYRIINRDEGDMLEILNELSLRNKNVETRCNEDYIARPVQSESSNGSQNVAQNVARNVSQNTTQDEEQNNRQLTARENVGHAPNGTLNGISKGDYTRMLDNLNPLYYDNYSEWLAIGMITKNIYDEDGIDLFLNFSKKSEKYDETAVRNKYNGLRKDEGGLNIGTLCNYLKESGGVELLKELNNKYRNMKSCLMVNKDELKITEDIKIYSYEEIENKQLQIETDAYCLLCKTKHETRETAYILTACGQLWQICRRSFGKIKPCPPINIDRSLLNGVFIIGDNNITNIITNNGTINQNGNTAEKKKPDELLYNGYEEIIRKDRTLYNLIHEGIYGIHYKIAKIVYYLYKNKYNCIDKIKWYKFEDHHWKYKISPHSEISEEIPKYLSSFQSILQKKCMATRDENDHIRLEKEIEAAQKIRKNMDAHSFRSSVLKDAAYMFSENNPNFEENLNRDNNLLSFNNGIYDLKKMEFRKGEPDDNISITIGYDYIDTYSEHKDDLIKFLEDIQPNKDDRDYLLKYIASTLSDLLHIFIVLSGDGRNGKSVLANLLQNTLTCYHASVSTTLLTKPMPESNIPRPDLLQLMNKKIVIAKEPEDNSKLNSSLIKTITGRDELSGRTLYSDVIQTFIAEFGLVLVCNDIPEFDKNDNAIWARCVFMNFPTEFVKNPTLPYQKKIDEELYKKIKYWRNDFILLLLEYHKKFKREGLNETENIISFTKTKRGDTDIYERFLTECTKRCEPSEHKHIHRSNLYKRFIDWYTDNNISRTVPSSHNFSNEMGKKRLFEKVLVDNISGIGIKNIMVL